MWPNMFKKNTVNNENNKNGTLKPSAPAEDIMAQQEPQNVKPQLVFHCQLAHGSSTGLIAGFSNVRELYEKIADVFDIPANEVRKVTNLKVCYIFLYAV